MEKSVSYPRSSAPIKRIIYRPISRNKSLTRMAQQAYAEGTSRFRNDSARRFAVEFLGSIFSVAS